MTRVSTSWPTGSNRDSAAHGFSSSGSPCWPNLTPWGKSPAQLGVMMRNVHQVHVLREIRHCVSFLGPPLQSITNPMAETTDIYCLTVLDDSSSRLRCLWAMISLKLPREGSVPGISASGSSLAFGIVGLIFTFILPDKSSCVQMFPFLQGHQSY